MLIITTDFESLNVEPGDQIEYEPWLGGPALAVVTECYEDIKDGRPGFSLRGDHWCYAQQVLQIVHKHTPV